jgi:hypothetical protein
MVIIKRGNEGEMFTAKCALGQAGIGAVSVYEYRDSDPGTHVLMVDDGAAGIARAMIVEKTSFPLIMEQVARLKASVEKMERMHCTDHVLIATEADTIKKALHILLWEIAKKD